MERSSTLEAAVEFYCTGCDDNFFNTSPAAAQIGGFNFNDQTERIAVTEFLETLVPPAAECVSGTDCNANGITDSCEIALFAERDCDEDGVPDSCELDTIDCNSNSIADACDISGDPAIDCNGNGVPDSCERVGTWINVDGHRGALGIARAAPPGVAPLTRTLDALAALLRPKSGALAR